MYLYPIIIRFQYLLLGLLLFISPILSFSQFEKERYYIKHFGLEAGLSQIVTTDIIQDKNGFLWISTYDGLNRFDGYQFKIFRSIPKDSTSLPSSKILKLFYDGDQHLWLQSNNELRPFNIEKGRIENVAEINKLRILNICIKNNRQVWLYDSSHKLILVNKKSLKIEFTSLPNNLIPPSDEIQNLVNTPKELFAISKAGHIYIYNIITKKWSKETNPASKTNAAYNTVAYDFKQTIFIGSMQSDLLEYNILTHKFIISPATSLTTELIGINDLLYSKQNKALIISTYGQGIFYYNIGEGSLFQYKKGDPNFALAANYPLCIMLDQQDAIWVGYDGSGIDVLDPNIRKFIPLKKDSSDERFNLKFVRKIIEDNDGIIWFATAGSGLIEYNRKTKKFIFHNSGDLMPKAETFIIEMEKVNTQLWLGLNGGGVLVFDIANRKIVKKFINNEGHKQLTANAIWSFHFDNEKQLLWAGTPNNGLNLIDIGTNKVKEYYSKNDPLFDNNGMRCMYKTVKGAFYVGTTKGLLKYNTKADVFERVFPKPGIKVEAQHSIKVIFQDVKGRLWLGTDGAGIIVLSPGYKQIANFSTKDYLNNNVVYGILPQSDHVFWISTNHGLSKIIWDEKVFSRNKKIIVNNYLAKSGLQENEFNTNSYAKLADGSLAFGGIAGANIFKGEDIQPSKKIAPVVITDFSVFNRVINNNQLTPYLKQVNLAYNQNSFSLSYNTVGLILPESINYRYRLVGYDNNWNDANNRTYVSYTNLVHGSYEFQVKASNYDGVWGDNYTSLAIHISAPFYKTWWFILACLGLLTLVFVGFYKSRKNERLIRENLKIQYTKEIAEVEMKALRAQINPHFLFNSLNSINNFILKNDNANARKYLVKFSQLVRNILNNSSSPYVSLKEELDTVRLYIQIESMRFDNQFSFNLITDPSLSVDLINIPSLLLQPYVENAIWHGLLHKEGKKHIEIRIKQTNPELISIEIEDNGIGRRAANNLTPKENRRKSYGMELGANRLKLMHSEHQIKGKVEVIDLYDINKNEIGTLIAITLPILKINITNSEISN